MRTAWLLLMMALGGCASPCSGGLCDDAGATEGALVLTWVLQRDAHVVACSEVPGGEEVSVTVTRDSEATHQQRFACEDSAGSMTDFALGTWQLEVELQRGDAGVVGAAATRAVTFSPTECETTVANDCATPVQVTLDVP